MGGSCSKFIAQEYVPGNPDLGPFSMSAFGSLVTQRGQPVPHFIRHEQQSRD